MAVSQIWFKLLLFYLHLVVVFEYPSLSNHPSEDYVQLRDIFGLPCGNTRKHGSDWEGLCWLYFRDRSGRRHIGFGAGRAFCIEHGRKPNTSFFLAILMLSGDICPNPGNIMDPCGICKKAVRNNQRSICCDLCNTWFHIRRQCLAMQLESFRKHRSFI